MNFFVPLTTGAVYQAGERLRQAMEQKGWDLDWYTSNWYPIPLRLSEEFVNDLVRVQRILREALRHRAHCDNGCRIERTLPFSEWETTLFQELEGSPYEPGALRPDFLIDKTGRARICEINARFPSNGFFISLYTEELLASVYSDFRAPGTLHGLRSDFQFSSLTIVKASERGYDLHLLRDELGRRGVEVRVVGSESLTEQSEGGWILLELEKQELESLPSDALLRLHLSGRYFNDLRTVILVTTNACSRS